MGQIHKVVKLFADDLGILLGDSGDLSILPVISAQFPVLLPGLQGALEELSISDYASIQLSALLPIAIRLTVMVSVSMDQLGDRHCHLIVGHILSIDAEGQIVNFLYAIVDVLLLLLTREWGELGSGLAGRKYVPVHFVILVVLVVQL